MSYTVQFAPEALDQLQAIEDYIAHAGSTPARLSINSGTDSQADRNLQSTTLSVRRVLHSAQQWSLSR